MKQIITFLFIVSILYQATAQDDVIETIDIYTMKRKDFTYNNKNENSIKIDTLRTYDVELYETQTPFGVKYTANGNEITKKQYDKYREYWTTIDACAPCYLNTYDINDNLKHSAFQFVTCLCGEYKEFYSDGSKRTEGNYMENKIGSWENYKNQNFCNRKQGTWKYYLPNGNIDRIEEYNNGVLINITKGTSELIPAVDVYQRTYPEEQQDTEKKSIFKKKK